MVLRPPAPCQLQLLLVDGCRGEEEGRALWSSSAQCQLCSLARAPVLTMVLFDPLQRAQGSPKLPQPGGMAAEHRRAGSRATEPSVLAEAKGPHAPGTECTGQGTEAL